MMLGMAGRRQNKQTVEVLLLFVYARRHLLLWRCRAEHKGSRDHHLIVSCHSGSESSLGRMKHSGRESGQDTWVGKIVSRVSRVLQREMTDMTRRAELNSEECRNVARRC